MTNAELATKINEGLKAKGYGSISAAPITNAVLLKRSNGKPAGTVKTETLELANIDGALLRRDLKAILGIN